MSKNKQTPGPWKALGLNWGWQIVPSDPNAARFRRVIAAVGGTTEDPRKDPVSEANARLIAAAPELLAAAEDLLVSLVPCGPDPPDWRLHGSKADKLLDAIRKARGEGER